MERKENVDLITVNTNMPKRLPNKIHRQSNPKLLKPLEIVLLKRKGS